MAVSTGECHVRRTERIKALFVSREPARVRRVRIDA